MVKKKFKIAFILLAFVSAIMVFFSLNVVNNKNKSFINDTDAKVIQIENKKITNITNKENKSYITTNIKNNSNETISNINIDYVELDKNENEIASGIYPLEVALNKNQKALISIIPKNYTYTIDITGYSYTNKDYSVKVNLEKDDVNIKRRKKNNNNIDDYNILEMSGLKKVDKDNYEVIIKNISEKNLGNIILKVAEKNPDGEYIKVNHVTYNTTLVEKEKTELILSSSKKENSLEIVGYTYDDIESKSNIEINLKTNNVNIIKN